MKIKYVGQKKVKTFEIAIGRFIEFKKNEPVDLPERYALFLINACPRDFKPVEDGVVKRGVISPKTKSGNKRANNRAGRGGAGNVKKTEKPDIQGDK